jgi:hypothetical protein
MKKYNQSITVTVFNRMDLICQLIDVDRVSFDDGNMYVWNQDGHIIGSYNLRNGHKWRIVNKGWDTEFDCWSESIIVDLA